MTIKATHNIFIYNFLRLYIRFRVNTTFRKVYIESSVEGKSGPLLVLANHFSWWDGFWIMYMNMKLFGKKFYFMMLEEQLRKNSFFNKAGGFPVRKNSKSIIESLDYAISLLQDKENMVMVFPQGRIESAYSLHFSFEKGVQKIIDKAAGTARVIFVVNLVEYLSCQKPSLYIYLEEFRGMADAETAYNMFYARVMDKHREKTKE